MARKRRNTRFYDTDDLDKELAESKATDDTISMKISDIEKAKKESEEAKDDDGNNIVIARGQTLPNKDSLKRLGFRWSSEKRIWWIAA